MVKSLNGTGVNPAIASKVIHAITPPSEETLSFKNKTLDKIELNLDHRSAATVVLVSGGYPSSYNKGIKITGIDHVVDSTVYHAGAIREKENIYTNGGRVLAVTSLGKDTKESLEASYKAISKIEFENQYYRRDIGFDL